MPLSYNGAIYYNETCINDIYLQYIINKDTCICYEVHSSLSEVRIYYRSDIKKLNVAIN